MTMTCDDIRDLAPGFVLGALTAGEAADVRAHLETCAEPHAEFAELGGVVPYLADTLDPVEPPADLRARLLAAAAADRPALRTTAATPVAVTAPVVVATPVALTAPMAVAAPIPFPTEADREARSEGRSEGRSEAQSEARSRGTGGWLLRIAAVLAVAILGAWNLQLQARLSGVEGDLAAAQAYRAGVAAVLDVAGRPGAQAGFLAAADSSTTANGVVAAENGSVIMAVQNLAPTTGTAVYEAWVIVGAAAPVPLGGFQVGVNGTGVFRAMTDLAQSGAILALTLESGPGATTPTLPVLTLGSISGASG